MTQKNFLVLTIATTVVVGACQSPQSRTEIEPPTHQPQPINCANPMLFPDVISAKYTPNAKPGFDSPEEVTAFLEKRWPLADVRKFTIPERRHNDEWQNLVPYAREIWAG